MWRHELECHQSQTEPLQEKLMEVKASIKFSEDDAKRELEHLWQKVQTTAILLTYPKSIARIMGSPHMACASCGIKHQDGVGLVGNMEYHYLIGLQMRKYYRQVETSLNLLMQMMEHKLVNYESQCKW